LYPRVRTASPVGQPGNSFSSVMSWGPAARWIAPSTPPPPRSAPFAALTMASVSSVVMSAVTISIIELRCPFVRDDVRSYQD
jgi:hypothetical protein